MMRAIFAAFLLVWVGGTAQAQTPGDPVAFIRAIYAGYERDKPADWDKHPYTPRMRKAIVADKAYAKGEVGRLDFDPFINGQDYKLTDVSVTLVSQAQDKAVVEAKFSNLGDAQDLRYDLVRSNGRWLIDEIQSMTKPRWTMSKILVGAPDAFEKEQ
ncbi:MAG TPA: DUF3828 domain-containing protein [Stellaceae bacterium]|nr:DUF3828 domain-containing protein [Stellaceae bacterium]